jgi:two-component system NarL family sensor kinase
MRLAFRVAREGVLNVVHHSGAEHAVVSVSSSDTQGLHVSVRDDGHNGVAGIPDPESGHLGLRILHDVVVDLGGQLSLRSTPDGGTELAASLPIEHDAEGLATLLPS